MTPRVCIDGAKLPGEFNGELEDQILVATARAVGAAVVIPDRKIRRYAHVAAVWQGLSVFPFPFHRCIYRPPVST